MPRLLILVPAVFLALSQAEQQEASAVLAAARQALGGEAALQAVRTFTVEGNTIRTIGRLATDASIEIAFEAPDKFAHRITRFTGGGGPGPTYQIVTRDGFNGADVIHEVVSNTPFPAVIPASTPRTPAEVAALDARRLLRTKQNFARHLMPLFAASMEAYPLTFTAAGQVKVGNTVAHAIDARAADGFECRLLIDTKTHLPVSVTWKAAPIVVASFTSTMSSRSGGPIPVPPGGPPMLPAGDPTVGLPLVDHVMSFSHYRTDGGLTWPSRFIVRVDGEQTDETRLGKFRINTAIKPSTFKVVK